MCVCVCVYVCVCVCVCVCACLLGFLSDLPSGEWGRGGSGVGGYVCIFSNNVEVQDFSPPYTL